MTPVRSRRGKLVHCMTYGIRRELAPEDLTPILCGRKVKGAVVVDEEITCPWCEDILDRAN